MVQPARSSRVNLAPPALSATFKQLKDHAGTTFGFAAILCTPLAFFGVYTALRPGWAGTLVGFAASSLIGLLVGYGATVATGLYAGGDDPGLGGLVRRSFSAGLGRYLLTSLLFSALIMLGAGLALTPFLLSAASVGPQALISLRLSEGDVIRIFFGLLLSLPLLLTVMLFLYLKFGLAQPASALEGTGPAASLGRSWQLTKGRVWDLFVLMLMTSTITIAVSFFVSGPASLVSMRPAPTPASEPLSPEFFRELFARPEPLTPAAALVVGVSTYLTSVLLTPILSAALANFLLLVKSPPQPAELGSTSRLVPLRHPGAEPAAERPEPARLPDDRDPPPETPV